MSELRAATPRGPLWHLAVVSLLVGLSFALCELFHLTDPHHWNAKVRPEVHLVFLPHGMLVLLAWIYGWSMVPLVLPSFLIAVAFIVGPDFMTPTAALLTVSRILAVMLAFEVLRRVCCDARRDGRSALFGLFAAGLGSSLLFNLLRVRIGHCCEVMTGAEKAMAYAVAVGADLVGLVAVMLGAMLLFRLMRQV